MFKRQLENIGWYAVPAGMYLVLALLYLWAVPAGESPDEPGHMRCLEQVAIENHLPIVARLQNEAVNWWARENIISDYMCYHMPAYYVSGGLLLRMLATISNTPAHFEFPPMNPAFNETPGMFIHNRAERAHSVPWVGVRLLSILLGLLMLWGTARLAGRVFPNEPLISLLAVTLVAGWPQFIFLSRAITNDSLATALAIVVLVILTDVGKPGRFVWAALAAVLAFLTKLSVAFTVGMVLIVWVVEMLFQIGEQKRYLRPYLLSYLRPLPVMIVAFIGLALLLRFQPVLWRHWLLSVSDFSGSADAYLQLAYWQQVYAWTQSSGWAWFGWLSVAPPTWHAQLWWFLLQVGIIAGVYVALKRPYPRQHRLLLLILALWWLAVAVSYIRVTGNRWQPQFRFAFAVIPLLTTFAAGSILLLPQRLHRWAIWCAVAAGLFIYNLWLIWYIILPAYA